jgi:DNA (cytosine-5)-methyltransferase 1
LQEAARKIGVAAITLKRWLLAGKVGEVARDRNNWRRFTDRDIARIRKFASKLVSPGRR